MSNYYWAGQGVYNFDGTDYARGDKLPDAVPAETLAALLEKGKVSTSPLAAPAAPQADAELVALRTEVKKLRDLINDEAPLVEEITALRFDRDAAQATLQQVRAELVCAEEAVSLGQEEIADLRSQLAAAQKTISDMTTAQLAPPAPAPPAPPVAPAPAAGPKK